MSNEESSVSVRSSKVAAREENAITPRDSLRDGGVCDKNFASSVTLICTLRDKIKTVQSYN